MGLDSWKKLSLGAEEIVISYLSSSFSSTLDLSRVNYVCGVVERLLCSFGIKNLYSSIYKYIQRLETRDLVPLASSDRNKCRRFSLYIAWSVGLVWHFTWH